MQYNEKSAGIYIHIPFCRKACHYCNFHFSTSMQHKSDYVEALLQEIRLRHSYTGNRVIGSIYFGGGTPSLLSESELGKIMSALHNQFSVASDAEITLEANPDDIDQSILNAWKKNGINRLSIGVQSFRDADLQRMNRAHTSKQAGAAIMLAQDSGLENLSADLIYGLPQLDDDAWMLNMRTLVSLGVQHISSYALTIEPKTALAHFIATGKEEALSDQETERQFHYLRGYLQEQGFTHYEISNFARAGHMAVHNSGYWRGMHYAGLGAAAHSYNGTNRQWNVANNAQYIRGIQENNPVVEVEELSVSMRMHEMIMISLRTQWGLSLSRFSEQFGEAALKQLLAAASPLIASGNLIEEDGHLHIPRSYWFIADSLIAELFFDIE